MFVLFLFLYVYFTNHAGKPNNSHSMGKSTQMGIINTRINIALVMLEQSLKQYSQRTKVIPSNTSVSRTNFKNKYRNTKG